MHFLFQHQARVSKQRIKVSNIKERDPILSYLVWLRWQTNFMNFETHLNLVGIEILEFRLLNVINNSLEMH